MEDFSKQCQRFHHFNIRRIRDHVENRVTEQEFGSALEYLTDLKIFLKDNLERLRNDQSWLLIQFRENPNLFQQVEDLKKSVEDKKDQFIEKLNQSEVQAEEVDQSEVQAEEVDQSEVDQSEVQAEEVEKVREESENLIKKPRSFKEICRTGAEDEIIRYLRKAELIDSMSTSWTYRGSGHGTLAASVFKVFHARNYFISNPTNKEYKSILLNNFSLDISISTISHAKCEEDSYLKTKCSIPVFSL